MENVENEIHSSASNATPKVTGIGGIFFFSEDPEKMRAWYAQHLGLEANAWGSVSFDSRNINNPEAIDTLQWSPFPAGDAYFAPSAKPFMINYRVQQIEALVANLREKGVTILDDIATYDFGKFVHIMDAEGNKIELWEPADGGK